MYFLCCVQIASIRVLIIIIFHNHGGKKGEIAFLIGVIVGMLIFSLKIKSLYQIIYNYLGFKFYSILEHVEIHIIYYKNIFVSIRMHI